MDLYFASLLLLWCLPVLGLIMKMQQESSDPNASHWKDDGLSVVHSAALPCHILVDKHPAWCFFCRWYLLIVHFICLIIFSITMLYWVNGKTFAVGNKTISAWPAAVDQPAVTTIISTCLLVARTITGAWQTLSAWRCLYILLEKTGLRLSSLKIVASWCLPPISNGWRWKREQLNAVMWAVTGILLLAWPAQLANPIAAGAVTWVPTDVYKSSSSSLSIRDIAAESPWYNYANYANDRLVIVQTAAGLANSANELGSNNITDSSFERSPSGRIVLRLATHPYGTLVEKVTVPLFNIKSLTWVSENDLPSKIRSAIRDPQSGLLTVATNISPLTYQNLPGAAALLRETIWAAPDISRLPDPHTIIGTRYAAIYISRYSNNVDSSAYPCGSDGTVFDSLPLDLSTIKISSADGNYTDCIAVAKLEIEAGVTTCGVNPKDISSVSNLASKAHNICFLSQSSPARIISSPANLTLEPHPLVSEVVAMMPEVQALHTVISGVNLEPSRLAGSLERYLSDSLVSAYQSTWSALTDTLASMNGSSIDTRLWEPLQVLRADVSFLRIYLYLGLHLLVTLSGLILIYVQSTCCGKIVDDHVLSTILLDSTAIINHSDTGLCNAVSVGQVPDSKMLRLRLEVCSRSVEHKESYITLYSYLSTTKTVSLVISYHNVVP